MNTPPANASRLFLASRIALIVTAVSFALRGGANAQWATQFHLTHEQVGWIDGTAFWGFTLAMVFGGPLCDALGLGRILGIAFVGHLAGIVLTMTATGYSTLYAGTLLFGIANGSVEAACNPLVATLYSHDKTTYLNRFHVWFPGGIVLGGLWAYVAAKFDIGWRIQFGAMLIPLVIYGIMFFKQPIPATERVQTGVSTGRMFSSCFQPLFILMVICMLMTAATELGTTQWIPAILEQAGVSGILILCWINGLMAVGRQFAGPFVHRFSPKGMLVGSAILSALGILAISHSTGMALFAAATLFAFGVCFFWPTMLGFVNERFPETGAVGLAIMGGAGMLSTSFVIPIIGRSYDAGIARGLSQADAGLAALGRMVILPAILTVIFIGIYLFTRPVRTVEATVPAQS